MPFDALTYKTSAAELNSLLSGGRIERIGMPNKDDILVSVRPAWSGERRASVTLIMSANPSRPRVHITRAAAENPLSAYSFLMHLRKHIGGGVINSVTPVAHERIITFAISASDELGYKRDYVLYAELMGRYSNIILTDGAGKITDAVRHVSFDDFSARAVLPGVTYALPPKQDGKIAPDDGDGIRALVAAFGGGSLADYLMHGVYGFAPTTMKQAVYFAYGELLPTRERVVESPEKLIDALNKVMTEYRPCVRTDGNKIVECYAFPYTHVDCEFTAFDTLNEAMDAYFSAADERGFMAGKTAQLAATLRTAIKKNGKSLALLKEKMLVSRDFELDRVKGELITSNIYQLKPGMKKAVLNNYYTGEDVEIQLDETLSPALNAQRYYKLYAKKKTAIAKSAEQIKLCEEREDYLMSMLAAIDTAENEADVAEISAEMENAGLLKRSKDKKKIKRGQPISLTVDGFKVVIGKNNTQNDAIVRASDGGWLWLHTQKIHGSHGVIQATNVPQDTINKVAAIIAYYSKARMSANVPVDYTLIKHVKKPSGSAPGKVIYTHQQTVNVTPNGDVK